MPITITNILQFILAGDALYLVHQIVLKWALASFVLYFVKQPLSVWAIRGSLALYTALSIVFWFVAIFQCGAPYPTNFLNSDNCLSWNHFLAPMAYTSAALNALMDWLLTIAPVYVVAHLNMSVRDKATVTCLLLLGALGSIASVIRLFYVPGLDFENDFGPVSIRKYQSIETASIAESGIGMVGLSLVAFRPLLVELISRARTLIRGGSSARTESIEAPLKPNAHTQLWKKTPIVEESIDLPSMRPTITECAVAQPALARETPRRFQRLSIGGTPIPDRSYEASIWPTR